MKFLRSTHHLNALNICTSEGNGSNHNIRIHPEDQKAIILEDSPNSFFHFRNVGMEVANYYSGGKFVGVAQFVRK